MPANKKYLNPSFHQRFAKITAGFIGGFLITSILFLLFALIVDHAAVFMTLKFAGFIVWCVLMILPFLFKNGWKAWAIYLAAIIVLGALFYFLKPSPELLSAL
ncbi:hypothetical protein LVD15_00470 [Fulvivirga maritima]|uniref:hypothetical protein n=1 Tax=Fulvivirga maritima TaxID=2904247 RepID=UPI001F2A2064|nr:hypothetical protein [Fulvivirga maritima]UII26945.1 hypothetical protein LVD15_00470 [Fulvivirga maritima]